MKGLRKKLAEIMAVLLVIGMMPVMPGTTIARADTAVKITMDPTTGVPTATEGIGWHLSGNTLALDTGYAFTIINECKCAVLNYGTITYGTFSNATVTNSGVIDDGNFNGYVASTSIINNGIFNGTVAVLGNIFGGQFNGEVVNGGLISDGTFKGKVTNSWTGGMIEGGDFEATVTNEENMDITGGLFKGIITNKGMSITSSNVQYGVTYDLENIEDPGKATLSNASGQEIQLTAKTGYYLPAEVTVTMNGNTAIKGTDYTYNNGLITIDYTKVDEDKKGPVAVAAAADRIHYTVHFDKNNAVPGSRTMQDEKFFYNEPQALTKNNFFVPGGYLFNGWNTAADGSGNSYADGAVVQNLTSVNDGIVTLYAQWKLGNNSLSADKQSISFPDTIEGEVPSAQTVEITNTGDTNLPVHIDASDAPDFDIVKVGGNGGEYFVPGQNIIFAIQPKAGLAPGEYSEEIVIQGVIDSNYYDYITISLSYTVLSKDDTVNLVETETGDTLNASRNAIYASPSNASESDAEIRYCDTTIGFDPATLSDAAEIQHFKLGKSQKLKSFTWDGVTYTKWKVFFTEDTTTCKYIYVMHNQAWEIAFDGNGGTAGTASGKTNEDGYLTSLPIASRSGYTFAGWYTDKTGGTQVSKSTQFTSNATLYAHWTSSDGDSDGDTAYTGSSGKWLQDSTGWWYQNSDGTWPSNTWKQINGKWYHFDSNGYMQTGWILDNGKWYYLDGSGAMVTGYFHAPDGYWYYFWADGSMAVGDVTVDGKQRHFNDQLPPNPTYDKDPDTGIWYPNGNTDLPYGAEIE
jgi:uncharacterized repeat protein (TIGR02543 family)